MILRVLLFCQMKPNSIQMRKRQEQENIYSLWYEHCELKNAISQNIKNSWLKLSIHVKIQHYKHLVIKLSLQISYFDIQTAEGPASCHMAKQKQMFLLYMSKNKWYYFSANWNQNAVFSNRSCYVNVCFFNEWVSFPWEGPESKSSSPHFSTSLYRSKRALFGIKMLCAFTHFI